MINCKTSREIYTLYAETAQVGSREYNIFCYTTSLVPMTALGLFI